MSGETKASTSNGVHEEENAEMNVYKKEACKVVTFRIIYDEDDLKSDKTISFKPEMAHQIFGESESIFGYRNLSITINFLHNSCQCFIDIKSSGKIRGGTMKADDILKSMDPWMPKDYALTSDAFNSLIKDEVHDQMFGEVIHTFSDKKPMQRFPEENIKATYKITQTDMVDADESFVYLHSRFETYIMWFIDAANFIELDDERWLIFYVYEEFEHPVKKKIYRSPVGFCTVYRFFAFPNKFRARISQFFVLPSHQKRGIGSALYEVIAKAVRGLEDVVDITVEEPTASFQKIRDLADCGMVHLEMLKTKMNYFSANSKTFFELGRRNKIGRRQIQRIYDILGLYYATQQGSTQYEKMLENIKNRLAEEIERASRPGKRFRLMEGAVSIQVDKKTQVETEFKRYCDGIEPSVKYLDTHLKGWLQKEQRLE